MFIKNERGAIVMSKYIWPCISLTLYLALVGPAGAGEYMIQTVRCERDKSTDAWACKPHILDSFTDPCLATMETAMRAMDRFMPTVVLTEGIRLSQQARYEGRYDKDWLAEFTASAVLAQHQWDAAKACWKDTP